MGRKAALALCGHGPVRYATFARPLLPSLGRSAEGPCTGASSEALQLPSPENEVRWQCPCCPLALLASQAVSFDQAYAIRLKHHATTHSEQLRERFTVVVPRATSQANTEKATRAVRAAQSRRIQVLRPAQALMTCCVRHHAMVRQAVHKAPRVAAVVSWLSASRGLKHNS